MVKQILLLVFIPFILIGCVKKEILDDVNLGGGLGLDYINNQEILGTAVVPFYKPDKSVQNVTFTTTATINRELLFEMQRQSAQPLVVGSLEVVLFGEELAQKGVFGLIDAFQRDATIGERLYLTVVDGKANEIIEGKYGVRGNSTYISDLLEHNIKSQDLPTTNLHLFIFDFFQVGKDPFLPKIKKISSNKLKINGVSIFKDDKEVDVVPSSKLFFFKLLVDKYSEGFYKLSFGKNKHSAIRDIKSKHNYDLTKINPTEITIHIKLKGAIREYTGKKLTPKNIKRVKKNLEKKVNQESMKLIKHFQSKGIDPLGLGHFVKTRTRNFDIKKWEQNYENVTVKVKTDVVIIDAGVIE